MTSNRHTDNPSITTSYGKSHKGIIYGTGYGKDAELTSLTDTIAVMLHKLTGLSVVKRGNARGKSCGAYHDGQYGFGLKCHRDSAGNIFFRAYFESSDTVILTKKYLKKATSIRYAFRSPLTGKENNIHVSSREFSTANQAAHWLMKVGKVHCPALRNCKP